MAMMIKRTTRSEVEVVLACDPAVQDANKDNPEALERYKASGARTGLTIPADATRLIVRPLSVEERMQVQDATDEVIVEVDTIDRSTPSGRAALLKLHRRMSWASVKLALVKAIEGGCDVPGRAFLDALPDHLLYPAVMELAAHITRISTLDETTGKA